jgi:dihydrofolate reductase
MNIIVAANNQNGIGFENSIPWKNKNDMQFFRMMTYGKAVYMGRKTYESIGKPLKSRINCVLSTQRINKEGVIQYRFDDDFLLRIRNDDDGFVIGGEQIYNLVLKRNVIKNIYLSRINDDIECDRFFYVPDKFYLVSKMVFEDICIERYSV